MHLSVWLSLENSPNRYLSPLMTVLQKLLIAENCGEQTTGLWNYYFIITHESIIWFRNGEVSGLITVKYLSTSRWAPYGTTHNWTASAVWSVWGTFLICCIHTSGESRVQDGMTNRSSLTSPGKAYNIPVAWAEWLFTSADHTTPMSGFEAQCRG